ncbi:MAG: hypothetical protein DHS80DRAFT_25422 [Piptocephalis tieghemiana]|nr:MAG: hypothetical protein DHS80DRAFT_25422 [Piptocephalis tieghemiana]
MRGYFPRGTLLDSFLARFLNQHGITSHYRINPVYFAQLNKPSTSMILSANVIPRSFSIHPPPLEPSYESPRAKELKAFLLDRRRGKPVWLWETRQFQSLAELSGIISTILRTQDYIPHPLERRPLHVPAEAEHVQKARHAALLSFLSSPLSPSSPTLHTPDSLMSPLRPPTLPWEFTHWGLPTDIYDPTSEIATDFQSVLTSSLYDRFLEEYIYDGLSNTISWNTLTTTGPNQALQLTSSALSKLPDSSRSILVLKVASPAQSVQYKLLMDMLVVLLFKKITWIKQRPFLNLMEMLTRRASVPVGFPSPEEQRKEEERVSKGQGRPDGGFVDGGSLQRWLTQLLFSPVDALLRHRKIQAVRYNGTLLIIPPSLKDSMIIQAELVDLIERDLGLTVDLQVTGLLALGQEPLTLWGNRRVWLEREENGGAQLRWSIPQNVELLAKEALALSPSPSPQISSLFSSLRAQYAEYGGHSKEEDVSRALSLSPSQVQ